MSSANGKSYWLIQGYDGTTMFYERKVGASQVTQNQMKDLLKAMAAKAGLRYDEIVGAYASRRTKTANDLLHVRKDGPHARFSCGENPFFVASIVRE